MWAPEECTYSLMASLFGFFVTLVVSLTFFDSSYEADDEQHPVHNNYDEPLYKTWYIFTLIMCSVGIIGHISVGTTILTDRKYRRHLCYLMVLGQLLLDFLFNLYFVVRVPFTIVQQRTPLLRTHTLGCFLEGNVLLVFSACSLLSAAFIAYGRYRAICRPQKPLTVEVALKVYVLIWCYCITAVALMNLFSRVDDNPGGMFCTLDQNNWKVAVYVTFAGYIPGLGVAMVCYARVYMNLMGNSDLIGIRRSPSQEFHARVAKKMLFFFGFLVVCWSPAVYQTYARPKWFSTEATPSDRTQSMLMMVAGYGALLNSAGDPWLIMWLLPGLRVDCWRKLMVCVGCTNRADQSNVLTSSSSSSSNNNNNNNNRNEEPLLQTNAEPSPDDSFPALSHSMLSVHSLGPESSTYSFRFGSHNMSGESIQTVVPRGTSTATINSFMGAGEKPDRKSEGPVVDEISSGGHSKT